MKRYLTTLTAAILALCPLWPAADAPLEPGSKPENGTPRHGGGCCCAGCAGPAPMPAETPEKHDFSAKSL